MKLRCATTILIFFLLTTVIVQGIQLNQKIKVKYIEVEVPVYIEVEGEDEKPWVRDIELSEELQEYTYNLAEKYELDYNLILSVMYQESKFNPKATNKNTNGTIDRGLMQLNSQYNSWHAELMGMSTKEFDAFNPEHNIEAGILILNHYRQYWIDKGVADQEKLFKYTLNSYNAGINGYKRMGLISRSYDRKISNYKIKLETEGGI